MSKILMNQTSQDVVISDVGVTVPASGQYVVNPIEYNLFAGSDDIITLVGAGTIVVNDGSDNLSISDGVDLLKGLYPREISVSNERISIIESSHKLIHDGRSFTYSVVNQMSGNSHHGIAIVTPDSALLAHMGWSISVDGETELKLTEAPSLVLGDEISVINRNRSSAVVNTTRLYLVTGTPSGGTQIFHHNLGDKQNRDERSSEGREFVLKSNTEYWIDIYSLANTNTVSFILDWYEF